MVPLQHARHIPLSTRARASTWLASHASLDTYLMHAAGAIPDSDLQLSVALFRTIFDSSDRLVHAYRYSRHALHLSFSSASSLFSIRSGTSWSLCLLMMLDQSAIPRCSTPEASLAHIFPSWNLFILLSGVVVVELWCDHAGQPQNVP